VQRIAVGQFIGNGLDLGIAIADFTVSSWAATFLSFGFCKNCVAVSRACSRLRYFRGQPLQCTKALGLMLAAFLDLQPGT
jgi:hypothetical protein